MLLPVESKNVIESCSGVLGMYKQFEKSSSDTHMTSPGVDHLPLTAPVRGLVVPRHRRAVPRTGGLGNVCGEGGHRVSDPAARTGRSTSGKRPRSVQVTAGKRPRSVEVAAGKRPRSVPGLEN